MVNTVRKQIGDTCPKCQLRNVEYYVGASRCKSCHSRASSDAYMRRYNSNPQWRALQKKYSREKYQNTFDECACGERKKKCSKTCLTCFRKPAAICSKCKRPRDETFVRGQCGECFKECCERSKRRPGAQIRAKQTALARRLRELYGLTVESYQKLLLKQNNACAVCRSEWGPKGPCVDHDHTRQGVDAVRGLLCSGCNWAIGHLGDSADGLARALAYLRRYERGVSSLHPGVRAAV